MTKLTFVDKDDNVIGFGSREDALRKGIVHRVVRIYLFNFKGELLIQKRSKSVSSPEKWDQSAAGHVDEGEDYAFAAYRETKEEIGVTNVELTEIGKFYTEEFGEKGTIRRFNTIYKGVYDGEIKFNEEVSEVKWIKPSLLEEWMLKSPKNFSGSFIKISNLIGLVQVADKSTPSTLAVNVFNIVNAASKILLKYWKGTLRVDYKKDEYDPVTIADRESDALIRKRLHEIFPKDLILSEESTVIPESYEKRVWMIDPLDGTKGFITGLDGFSINIGLLENGEIVFGCVAVPARGKMFYAEKGKGAFEKIRKVFKKLHVSEIQNISDARLVTRYPGADIRPIETKIDPMPFRKRIPEGGVGTKLCLVASGNAEAHINTNFRASKWDTLGPQLILEEAGGMVTDFNGKKLDYKKLPISWERSFVASNNKKIHLEILRNIK